jgi:hypothetical protein
MTAMITTVLIIPQMWHYFSIPPITSVESIAAEIPNTSFDREQCNHKDLENKA